MENEESTVTIEETARLLGYNEQHIRTLVRQGKLTGTTGYGFVLTRIDRSAIDRYLASQTKARAKRMAQPKQDAGQIWKARIAPDKVDEAKRRLEEIGIALEPARKPKQAAG